MPSEASARVYAEFERRRAGLLYILQVALGVTMYALHRVLGPGEVLPLILIGLLYALYFVLRWPLWRRLYRRRGHLETRAGLVEAKGRLRFTLWFLPALYVLLHFAGLVGAPIVPAPLTLIAMWAVLAVFGRVPADHAMFLFALVASGRWVPLSRIQAGVWGLIALSYVVLGLWEHRRFAKAAAPPQAP